MSKRRLYFHMFLIVTSLLIGGISFWHSGWMSENGNYPNFTLIAMFLLIVSQVGQLKAASNQKDI